MLVHFNKSQMGMFANAQLRGWQKSIVELLRDCFPQRFSRHPDAAIRRLAEQALLEGARCQLTSEADLTRVAIAAALLGTRFNDDWQHNWLFNEQYSGAIVDEADSYSMTTLLHNLDRAVNEGLVSLAADDDFRARCQHAEQLVLPARDSPVASYRAALRWLNEAKLSWLEGERLTRFVHGCLQQGRAQQADNLPRYVLLAWLFGHGFSEDPLCDEATQFLRQKAAGRAHGR